jgi:membrane fusion protein (multidrug efflux system)
MHEFRWLTALAVIFLLIGLGGCQPAGDASDPAASAEAGEDDEEAAPVPVEVDGAVRDEVVAIYTGTAALETDEDAMVVAKVSGEVESISVEEGDTVRAGQVLARLDGDRLRLEMERARANLAKLEQEYKRNTQLKERGLVSATAFEDIKYEMDALRAAFNLARLEVSYTEIKAPVDGVVAQRFIKVGNTLAVNDPVFHITGLDPLIAYLHVPEKEFRKLAAGQSAEVRVDAIPDKGFAGVIERISPVVDPQTGTFKVTLNVTDPSGRLKPGMFGRFNVVYDRREDTLLVPRVAMVDDESEHALFVVENGKAVRRQVRTGYPQGDQIEIVEGLDGTEEIVVVGQNGLKDGMDVEVIRRANEQTLAETPDATAGGTR